MKRLFFALWPNEKTREKLHAVNTQIALSGRKLKPSNLHVTLLYLGLLDAKTQQAIVAKASNIKAGQFSFQLDGIQYWKKPRVLCLTASQQPQPLYDLVDQLVEIAKAYPMIHLHDRPYQAHVTMMRKATQGYRLDYAPIDWQAQDFVLVESVSTPQGIRYDILARWPLFGNQSG